MTHRLRAAWMFAFLVFAVAATAQVDRASLNKQIDEALAAPPLKHAAIGVLVQSLRDGSVWYERNADLRLTPASNNKLLTTATALHVLGPDFRYTTSLYRSGAINDDGELRGNLYLKGTGDFTLEPSDLDALVESVKVAGIRRIAGTVIADDLRFDNTRLGEAWSWDYLQLAYAAPVGALNLHHNVIDVLVEPGRKVGDPVRVSVTPSNGGLKFDIVAHTMEKGAEGGITMARDLRSDTVVIAGGLQMGAQSNAKVTVFDPGIYAAGYLSQKLRAAGITISQPEVSGRTPSDAVRIANHESEPLSSLLQKVNKPSDNLGAECLLKTIAAEKNTDSKGTWSAGLGSVRTWLKEIGVEEDSIRLADGSGLSHKNFVTARTLVKVLDRMNRHANAKVFADSLPVAGVDGTLDKRLKGGAAEKNCRAKTGTIEHSSALSGYVTTKDGEPLVFSILVNNQPNGSDAARLAQDTIVEALAAWVTKAN
jgi:D-alanyl-D-alanine carboxypeptidase/D-alanyl-D-alanine-endopeptidase (penicillin-binding protein 4)